MVMSDGKILEKKGSVCPSHEGNSIFVFIESVTRQKPYDTLFLKQVGVKPSYNKSKCETQNPFLQFLTGASPRI